jgi:hypothetical protein
MNGAAASSNRKRRQAVRERRFEVSAQHESCACHVWACHLAAGEDWLGMPVPHPVRVLLVENGGHARCCGAS